MTSGTTLDTAADYRRDTDFDQSYDQMQVKGHEDAVALFTAYAKGGADPELKKWAAKTLPNLEWHLTMAQKLK